VTRHPEWTPAEWEFLDRLIGDLPFPEVMARFQRHARRSGWPVRTRAAILAQLRRTGQRASGRCGSCLTTGAAATLLGCPSTRVQAWLRQRRICDILQPRWVGRTRYIERSAWRRLARERPQVLGGYSAASLYLLLEDRELADAVAAAWPRQLGDFRIRCIETGRIWRSAKAAAKDLHVTHSAISMAIRERRAVASLGMTFEALRRSG
jgi:hypothetical protein